MGNVVSMERPCTYYVSRAVKHRFAGRYDEAMMLLAKAKEQFGLREDIELEMARTYEALEYDDEAIRSYLRIVRLCGDYRKSALFRLALYSMKYGEINRALAYYQDFRASGDEAKIPQEAVNALEAQLYEQANLTHSMGRKARAKKLELRAVEHMHAGKTAAALRDINKAIALAPTARRYTLLAGCFLLHGQADAAVEAARSALRIKPGRIQTRCVLIDALYACGACCEARNVLYMASLKAVETDDLLAIAIESAKHGEDQLTLNITARILKHNPFHARANILRGCALINVDKMTEASRLFGRMCGLLPEDTICQAYYRMAREENRPPHRLDLGMDVDGREANGRMVKLLEHFTARQLGQELTADAERDICRKCAWAIESSMVGAQVKTVAVILLAGMKSDVAQEVLADCLMDAHMDDQFKLSMLKILTAIEGFKPYWVNLNGKIVRLAAGAVSNQPVQSATSGQKIVQRAADELIRKYPDAPEVLVRAYLKYVERYAEPQKREEAVFVSTLVYAYHRIFGNPISLKTVARKYGHSGRRCAKYARRMMPIMIQIYRECKSEAEVIEDELH